MTQIRIHRGMLRACNIPTVGYITIRTCIYTYVRIYIYKHTYIRMFRSLSLSLFEDYAQRCVSKTSIRIYVYIYVYIIYTDVKRYTEPPTLICFVFCVGPHFGFINVRMCTYVRTYVRTYVYIRMNTYMITYVRKPTEKDVQ